MLVSAILVLHVGSSFDILLIVILFWSVVIYIPLWAYTTLLLRRGGLTQEVATLLSVIKGTQGGVGCIIGAASLYFYTSVGELVLYTIIIASLVDIFFSIIYRKWAKHLTLKESHLC